VEIIEYALQNKLFWREDISNAKSDYQRNKWRNEYLPELRKTIGSIDDSVEFLQKVFQKNLRLIEDKIHFLAEEIKINQVVSDIEMNQLQLTELAELFRKLCIPLKMIIPFTKLINSQKGSKIEWFNSEKQKQEIIREDGGYYFNLTTSEKGEPGLTINLVNELPAFFDKNTFYFSPDKIKGNPFLRRWQKGDRIYPIGLAGSKLISDVLTDAKVPNWKRSNQFVLCDEEKILACVGFCVDRRAVSKGDTPIMKILITQ
jgi:tRNA(Ile)-lysidine synthase